MSDPRDYKLDLRGPVGDPPANSGTGGTAGVAAGLTGAKATGSSRPYLSILFACCGVYQRVYRAADGRSYQGRCPRCTVPVRFAVGEGGTGARSFVVR